LLALVKALGPNYVALRADQFALVYQQYTGKSAPANGVNSTAGLPMSVPASFVNVAESAKAVAVKLT